MDRREEREKRKRREKIRRIVFAAIFVTLVIAVVFSLKSSYFNVQKYEIEGNSYYTDDEIKIMGDCKTGTNIFIGIDVKDMKQRLLNDAFMENVEITRKLPSTVKIKLNEREQFCTCKFGKKYVVLSYDGTVLRKTSIEPMFPLISGITISKMDFGEKIEVEEKFIFDQSLEVIKAMYQNDMYFKKVEISEGLLKINILDNLHLIGEYQNIIRNLENRKIQETVLKLFEMKVERGTIKVSDTDYIVFTPEV